MRTSLFLSDLKENVGHEPTLGQSEAAEMLTSFISSDFQDEVFLLKGFAGTGKTTLIAALVKVLKIHKRKSVLLAPTGRAAKVLSNYSEAAAYTIHKKIYRQKKVQDGFAEFGLDRNLHKNTVFIVDESSMIANQALELSVFGSGRLLEDLVSYVYSGIGCKLIFCGDSAQLPPVGLDISEALNANAIESFGFEVKQYVLDEVVRQEKESGVLANATSLRKMLDKDSLNKYPALQADKYDDFIRVAGQELIETIQSSYDKQGLEETIIVCRSNKQANKYNQGIRSRILWKEEEISTGEQLMVVKNNYFWFKDDDDVDFIANGDIVELTRIIQYKELYGFRFAKVNLKFKDARELDFDCWIILDTLSSETASIDRNVMREFFFKVMDDYQHVKGKKNRTDAVREDEYFNALQVKYAYAVTCHKAQGGQWKHVYVDQGYITEDKLDREYYRWLYTAITRTSSKTHLVNFKDEFFE